ncbi:MAG: AAA+ family ATPase [Pseudomonadota bacterium]
MRTPSILAAGLALVLAATPAAAQEQRERLFDLDQMKRELDRIWDDLSRGMEPALDRLDEVVAMLRQVDDPRYYEAPAFLPNGDIVIRRREDAPPWQPPEDEEREAGPVPIDPDEGVPL